MDVLRAQKFKLAHTLRKVINIIEVYKQRDILSSLDIPLKDVEDLVNKINEIDQRLSKK